MLVFIITWLAFFGILYSVAYLGLGQERLQGEELHYYDVNPNSQVMVESTRSASIKSLTQKRKLSAEDLVKLIRFVAKVKSKKKNFDLEAFVTLPADQQVITIADWHDTLNDAIAEFDDLVHQLGFGLESSGTSIDEGLDVVEFLGFVIMIL